MRTVLSSSAVPCTRVNDVWVKASSNIAYMSAGNLESELQNVSQKRRPNCWWERKIAEAFTFSIEVLSSRVTKWGESGSNNNNNVGARYLKTVHLRSPRGGAWSGTSSSWSWACGPWPRRRCWSWWSSGRPEYQGEPPPGPEWRLRDPLKGNLCY